MIRSSDNNYFGTREEMLQVAVSLNLDKPCFLVIKPNTVKSGITGCEYWLLIYPTMQDMITDYKHTHRNLHVNELTHPIPSFAKNEYIYFGISKQSFIAYMQPIYV